MLGNYFDEIYCINLDKRKNRWAEASIEFSKIGILGMVKRFAAVDGSKIDGVPINSLSDALLVVNTKNTVKTSTIVSWIEKMKRSNFLRRFSRNFAKHIILSTGEIGCLLSHIEVIRKADEKLYQNVLIFEDDVIFCDDFLEKLIEFMDNVPSDWEMLYLGGNHNYHIGSTPEKINDFVIKCHETFTTHAIVITQSLYKRILDINSLNKPIDVAYAELQKQYKVYAPSTSLVTQRVGYSDIQNREANYDSYIR